MVLKAQNDILCHQFLTSLFSYPVWVFNLRPNEAFASLVDRSVAETVVNVLTSLPFIALGIQAPR